VAGRLTFTIYALDWDVPLGEIDTFERATMIARYNDVSTMELTLPATSAVAQLLLAAARPRLRVAANIGVNMTVRSGPVTRFERTSGTDGSETLVVTAVDDLVWLRRRLAHPQPGTAAPPYSTTAYDQRSGAASSVISGYVDRNAGPSAVFARQVPGLLVLPPAAFGPTVTVQARYDNLLEFVRSIANAAGVGIACRDLQFSVYQPHGRAVFSVDLGTLGGWEGVIEASEATYTYVGGGGEGTARVIRELSDGAGQLAWGRLETFIDRRDTTDPATLDQAASEALADARRPPVVTMAALDTDGQQFLVDWNVGDLAVVHVGGVSYQDVIAEAEIKLEPNAPPIVTPALGGASVNLAQWRRLNATARRVRQLERV